MQKRLFDPRVGFFATRYIKFSDQQQRTETEYYIHRFRLEHRKEDIKKYLSGQLVRPKKQIVFYIDPATPKQWQKYLILGVNDWNVAFEQAGFKEAIVAKEKQASDLKRKYFGPEGELFKKRTSLITPIQDEIYNAVKDIADQRGYSLVIDRSSNSAGIIYGSPKVDISNEVLQKLGYSKYDYKNKETDVLRNERYAYIAELTDDINNYNNVLTQWIQLQQGELSLHIESFPLQQVSP